ncbi:hypothetical protein ABZ281_15075 [Streptomyces sp. NPDC006265]|uniref:hypothetical protein n=1 Tax=Streptomyces sp. NPDC006265 TaxID=3156740 RepID=UPI0033ABF06D
MTTDRFPDIVRAGTAVIGTRYAGGPDRQLLVMDDKVHALEGASPPRGLSAVSWFASTDGESVLSLAQWESAGAYDAYLRGGGCAAPLAGPPRYRLYRSPAEEHETRVPGCLITAAFDVDGPERQRSFTDAVIAAQPKEGGHPASCTAPTAAASCCTRSGPASRRTRRPPRPVTTTGARNLLRYARGTAHRRRALPPPPLPALSPALTEAPGVAQRAASTVQGSGLPRRTLR